MVFIISESNDISTNLVIDWIVHLGYPFYRLNPEDRVSILSLSMEGFELLINNKDVLRYEEITSTWFRRGYINFTDSPQHFDSDTGFVKHFKNHISKENVAYADWIHYLLCKKKHIGTDKDFHINKFLQLDVAREVGLNIPLSYFIKDKESLKLLLSQGRFVTKSSNYVFDFRHNGKSYLTYTELLNNLDLSSVPEEFAMSFCQLNVEKYADVRVFYLDGICYSMLIMSQAKKSTTIDFRKYDFVVPNKSIPFALPESLENQIFSLMSRLNLVSGSLDFVLNKEGRYVFLEVNPIGQYGMVDYPCNYNLNKLIANYLINDAYH